VIADLRKRLSVIKDANVLTIPPPPVQGLGSVGGFKMMLEDRAGLGSEPLFEGRNARSWPAANKDPTFAGCVHTIQRGLSFALRRYRPVESGGKWASRQPTYFRRCR